MNHAVNRHVQKRPSHGEVLRDVQKCLSYGGADRLLSNRAAR